MIRSFRDRETERPFPREAVRKLPPDVRRAALRKLVLLDAAHSIEDLRVPPGNRLEKLTGNRAGQYSIRINDCGGCAFAGRKVTPRMSKSSTITKPSVRGRGRRPSPVSPGEMLQEEFLRPIGISQYRLAKALTVPPRRINEIVHGKRAVTADTALRLARHFGTSERFWLNLQTRYDLEIEKDRLGDRLRREVQVLVPAG
jgi:addiction module HigA family antidote